MTDPAALVAAAEPAVFWTDRHDAPSRSAPLRGTYRADLCIVGGGFTGLWAALQALEENPDRVVVILEADVCGSGASSRNGGFASASLTHGMTNGLRHWPTESTRLREIGHRNLDELVATLDRLPIRCDARRADSLTVARTPAEVDDMAHLAELFTAHGVPHTLLDEAETHRRLHSPAFHAGFATPDLVLVDPARLAWGLRTWVTRFGAVIHDGSQVTAIEADPDELRVVTEQGAIHAQRVIVATNAWAEPVKDMRRHIAPVYDHVLMTEPLSRAQEDAIGWAGGEGVSDAGNRFHYFRQTADRRILWGGYDANYHFGNSIDEAHELETRTHEILARHFFETFPMLDGLGFTHRWAGPIASTTSFTPAFGTRHGDRLAWVGGYTGLGVAASRFGARVALDLVDGLVSDLTDLHLVRRRPIAFPPEPFRWLGINLTRRALAAEDDTGRRGLWLRTLDRFGVGFDS